MTKNNALSVLSVPRVACRNLTRRLRSGDQELTVLDSVTLRVEAGESVAVLGPSGSGKSTLLGLLAGLDRPTAGTVELDGEALADLDENALALLRRRSVGFVFQSFQLLENLTAAENVLLPLELIGFRGARARTAELLERLGLARRAHHYPAQLSGGEQQRVALARAFATRPPLLLADEPTGSLDRETGARVLDLLVELRDEEGAALVLVTHDLDVAARLGRRIHLDGGRVLDDDGAAAIWPAGGERAS